MNPIIVTIEFFLFTTYTKNVSAKSMLKALIFPYCYLFYAIVYGYLSDVWIYGILNIPERGINFVVTLVLIAGLGLLFLEYVQYKISFYISKFRLKNS